MNISAQRGRLAAAAVLSITALVALSACSSGSDSTSTSTDAAAAGGTYTFWDPYPQFDETADWSKLVAKCGTDAGVTIERTGYDTSDLTSKALLAGQQGSSPDILVVDNPVVSTLADAGILTTTADLGLDTTNFEKNILAAGQSNGDTFGVPIGANTLALYYNKDILSAAGVDIASVTDWTSLNAALAKVTASGKQGITFSGIGTEEGSFQFLPWFWGAGAELTDLSSSQAVDAATLWTDWVKQGYAPNSVINNTQTTSWQEFLTGNFAFSENGTWQLAGADKSGLNYGVIPIPAKSGGSAAAPTGGEFVSAPVQSDTGRYATTEKIISCLTSDSNLLTTDTTLSYVAPIATVQTQQVAANAELTPWVAAVAAARGRTSDNLGTKYPVISQAMWGGFQNALSGSQPPADAMKAAQTAAAAAQ
ncbi:ABC transporter substrate-binding protein [Subtercola boreus]|uniref:ABC transporter substrate-binding protein n=1 Tax=Subtercola boreus TaxID=120213 RepID=A0A3E0VM59_9MICO|nr:extracellular solute-binding protein [Subtercola boreus]RFA10765.1 ABC transporter substrate-binding protein [Subtercola boreus]TQL55662.1 multiple sugar transport system substrate-binding protein [Subtercola boreus]